MLNFNRATALVMGILGLTGIVAGIATKTPHNIVIGVVCILLTLMCVHIDRIKNEYKKQRTKRHTMSN